jgi:ferrochelatase
MQRDGIKQAVAISLAPFYSKFSTGAYARSLGLALQEYQDIEIKLCQQWHMHPLYIRALAKQVKAALIGTSPRETGATPVVFTMHSLPLSHLEAEDPYVTQAQEAMTAVLSQLEGQPGFLAFQSKGGSLGPWLKPEVSSVLLDLSRAGYRRAVLLPFGFVSDHLETLYDLDIELQHYARSIGLELVRVPALNDNPDFILALADIARKNFNLFFAAGSSL